MPTARTRQPAPPRARQAAARTTSARPLGWAYIALVLYASLHPFVDWRWPPGLELTEWLLLPWPPTRHRLDEWINVIGYTPLGGLLFVAAIRRHEPVVRAALMALLVSTLLSYSMEVMQTMLPSRVPSLRDWVANILGAGVGVGVAWCILKAGLFERWEGWRERWFVLDSAGALALLCLWPLALVVPIPAPLALGPWWISVHDTLAGVLAELPLLPATVVQVLNAGAGANQVWSPAQEALATGLSLWAVCLLGLSVARRGWRRVAMIIGLALAGVGVSTLATGLNVGTERALTWLTDAAMVGFGLGLGAALASVWVSRRVAAVLGLMTFIAALVVVLQAPADPYFRVSVQAWEQGRFVHFHGLARWLSWLWPLLSVAWLARRVITDAPSTEWP